MFCFSRRIQGRLRGPYTLPRQGFSLRTKSARVAEARASRAAKQFDKYWYHPRPREAHPPQIGADHRQSCCRSGPKTRELCRYPVGSCRHSSRPYGQVTPHNLPPVGRTGRWLRHRCVRQQN
ncbi:MAG: DUF6538 domain-containing protein [Limimaricola soesokkakensis]|uniref:DUF6538 domain-containing protein n=1 Tax=Limimaricola soesokkakensis TaxID=1343159 RepID=UPI00405882DA